MKYPGCLIISVLEKISYETYVTITRFPCSVTVREGLANNLVDIGFIELCVLGYKITENGETFLNNVNK